MLDNNISDSVVVLDKFKNNKVWTGASSGAYSERLSELIGTLNNELAGIDKFEEALVLLDKIKKIDEEIANLKNSLLSIPEDASDDVISQYTSHNASVSLSVNEKIKARTELREKIISILSEFGIIADIEIINIPAIEGAKVIIQGENGSVYELKSSNGVSYEVYIPNTYTIDTPVIIYDAGNSSSGGINSEKNWNFVASNLIEENGNQIVIRSMRREDTNLLFDDVCDKLGVNSSNPIAISHSGGTASSLRTMGKVLENDERNGGVVAIMDGYVPYAASQVQPAFRNFEEKGTVVLAFCPVDEHKTNDYIKYYEGLASTSDVNMLILRDKNTYTGDYHNAINETLYTNDVMGYLSGDGTLPDTYEILKYDTDSKSFVSVDYSDVSTIQKTYEYFGQEYK